MKSSWPVVVVSLLLNGGVVGLYFSQPKFSPRVVWTARAGWSLSFGPAATTKAVYVATGEGRVVAFEARHGRGLWQTSLRGKPTAPLTANAEQGVVLAVDGSPALSCLDADTGRVRWQAPLKQPALWSAVGEGDRVYVLEGREESWTLRALATADGKDWWQRELSGSVGAPPRPAGDKVYVEGHFYGQEIQAATGTILRQYSKWAWRGKAPTMVGTVAFWGKEGQARAKDMKTGRTLWSSSVDGPICANPAAREEQVFFTTGTGQVSCFAADTGQVLWQAQLFAPADLDPALGGDLLFVGSRNGRLFAVDLKR